MTNRRFMDLVRQYADAARRNRVSYAEPVRMLLELRSKGLTAEGVPEDVWVKTMNKAEDFVQREYGKFDEAWVKTASD